MTTTTERAAAATTAGTAPGQPTPEPPMGLQRALPARRRRRRWPDALVLAALVVVVALVHAHALTGGPAPADDEGTYVAQAYAINHFGSLAPYTYWYDHPPLGWILLALWNATLGRLGGSSDALDAGREFLVVVASCTGALIYALARRLGVRHWAAAAAVLAWALSPLALSYSRMVYLDNIGVPLLLAALVLALSPRRHLWAFCGAGLLLAGAVLTKETLVLAAPAVGYAVWRTSAGRTRPFCLGAAGATFVLVLALYPLLALLRGELLPGPDHVSLVDALRFQLVTRPSAGSPLSPHSGAAALVGRWLHSDPWLLAGGVLLAPVAAWRPQLRPAGLALLIPVIASLRPGYLPDPFVVALLPFCAVVVAGLADQLVTAVALRLGGAGRRTGPLIAPRLAADGSGRWTTARGWRRARPALLASGLASALVAATALALQPSWSRGDRAIYDDGSQGTLAAAEDWIGAHVPHDARIVVDDTLWPGLVRRGFDPRRGVIWFYKTDFSNNLDPSVARSLPRGYRDFSYVVSSPVIRSALAQLPRGLDEVRAALRYSVPVAAFGSGDSTVEVRRLAVPADAPQLPSPVRP